MLFNSYQYLIFLPVVAAVYYFLPHRSRWFFLLVSSYFFYMCWKPVYALLILTTTIICYLAGIALETVQAKKIRIVILTATISSNLAILCYFKYAGFFAVTLSQLGIPIHHQILEEALQIILPVGISFYTLQAIGYAVDVYRGFVPAERHFGRFALYVSFFPQLVAGPIERAKTLLPQFAERVGFSEQNIFIGLRMILFGMLKKIVLADWLAIMVDKVYADPTSFTGPQIALALIAFSYQIYFDFSGYSDIAIGSARVLGFRIMVNFDRPYQSISLAEFWRRWHISLYSWFKDYVYIPFGGSRRGGKRTLLNILFIFSLSGLWHGANWTFVIWGTYHGVVLILARFLGGAKDILAEMVRFDLWHHIIKRAWRSCSVFSIICFGWIFFRAKDLGEVSQIVGGLAANWNIWQTDVTYRYFFPGMRPEKFWILFGLILVVELIQSKYPGDQFHSFLENRSTVFKYAWGILFAVATLNLGPATSVPFVYFQF